MSRSREFKIVGLETDTELHAPVLANEEAVAICAAQSIGRAIRSGLTLGEAMIAFGGREPTWLDPNN